MNKMTKKLVMISVTAVLAGSSVFAKVRAENCKVVKCVVSTGTSAESLKLFEESEGKKVELSEVKFKKKNSKKSKKYKDETEEEREERMRRLRELQDPLAK